MVIGGLWWAASQVAPDDEAPTLPLPVARDGWVRAQDDRPFDFTAEHLALLRKAVIGWVNAESGGPTITRFAAPREEILRLGGRDGGDAYRALAILLKFGELAPGDYSYANPFAGDAGSWPVDAYGDAVIVVPNEPEVRFHITADHLRLLHAACANGPGIDVKRPYGDMTCFYLDMGKLLGVAPQPDGTGCEESFTTDQLRRFDELHRSMAFALQTYLAHATIVPGKFARNPLRSGKWQRVAPPP
jgi:hypothetical protein